jgi:hypothetical protein
MAERRIRELQDMARTALVHANRRWPNAIEAYLWPYAVRHANECINNLPSMQDPKRRTPQQLFSSSDVEIKTLEAIWSTNLCTADKREGKPVNKWRTRATDGIYLGQSPIHNRQVALILDRTTGYMSPQLHYKIDTGSYTLQQEQLPSTWQVAASFNKQATSPGRPT